MKISCIIHTRNSGETIERAVASVAWADELIVVDMESTDNTLDIISRHNAKIFHQQIAPRVDGIRNLFLDKAKNEWIIVLDSDEYLPDDAEDNIKSLLNKYNSRFDAFAIPRFNRIAGQIMRGSGWYPDHQIRLFRKGCVKWPDAIHRLPEVLTGANRLLELSPPDCLHIHHLNYKDISRFIRRQIEYALEDVYDPDPANFDFSDYIARAYENLALHNDPETDGDLSHALSLLMAWDAVVRGILHWERLDPRPSLGYLRALPFALEKVPRRKIFFRKLRLRHYATAYVVRRLISIAKAIIRLK